MNEYLVGAAAAHSDLAIILQRDICAALSEFAGPSEVDW